MDQNMEIGAEAVTAGGVMEERLVQSLLWIAPMRHIKNMTLRMNV
jgi:hypothetical protein